MKKILFLAIFFLFSFSAFCQDENFQGDSDSVQSMADNEIESASSSQSQKFASKSLFSLDFGYLGMGLKNNGWGLGLSYEQSFFNYFAAKGSFSHMTLYPDQVDFAVTTVGIKLEALFYPFGSGLEKFYLGFGSGSDFLMYDTKDENGGEMKDTIITIYPEIGWKQNFSDFVIADIFFGYRILLNDPKNLSYDLNLVDSGVKYGARLKFNLRKIWQWIFSL